MKKILFIVEGEETEKQILENLNNTILKEVEQKIIPYKTNIYDIYEKLIEDEDFNIVEILNDKIDENLDPETFPYIYLIFDYDGHDSRAADDKIRTMIEYFNNETEKGKLYINYPMVEGIKHIKTETGEEFKDIVHEISEGSSYKNKIGSESYTKYRDLTSYDFEIWKTIIGCHLKKVNYLINDEYELQTKEEIKQNTQQVIFEKQKEKYIDSNGEVAVLNSIPLIIVENINEQYYKKLIGI